MIVRAYARVHPLPAAGAVAAVTALGSVLLASTSITDLGPIHFLSPVSALLLVPVVAGTAVAIASSDQVDLPLPDPLRAKAARGAWLTAWTALAVVAGNLGQLVAGSATASPAAVTRNVLLHTALATATATAGYPAASWLGPMLLTFVTVLFGSTDLHRLQWWAVLLAKSTTAGQWAAIAALLVPVVVVHVALGTRKPGAPA